MPLYYVTGIACSGKSTVLRELKQRGYETHEVDDGLAGFYDNATGQLTVRPTSPEERTLEWRQRHTWKIPRQTIERLSAIATEKPVFVCGTASNDEEFTDLFSKVIALVLDENTLVDRIATRASGEFGYLPHERETIVEWQKTAEEDYRQMGAVLVDATKPLAKVVDEVLAVCS